MNIRPNEPPIVSSRPRVVLAGGSGMLGRNLAPLLVSRGYEVVVLSRRTAPSHSLDEPHVRWRQWDNRTLGPWWRELDGADAVVNLAGRTVDCVKTPEHCREILESRVHSVEALGQALLACDRPPPVWVQCGTAHIHGDPQPPETLIEDDSPLGPPSELAPRVGAAWEAAFHANLLSGQRAVILRTSFVLSPFGGAMRRLILLTRLGLGGRIGDGRQYISWIHDHDMNALFLACITDDRFRGTYLVTAPEPASNADFMRAMRKAWRRPWSPPAPRWAVALAARYILRSDPQLALLGRRCVPKRLLAETPFTFTYPSLGPALADIAARHGKGA